MNCCSKCGKRIIEGALFCTECGASVEAASRESAEGSSVGKPREFAGLMRGKLLEDLLAVFKEAFVHPASAVERAASGLRPEAALLLVGILAALQGLLGMGFIRFVADSFIRFIVGITGYMDFSYGRVFFYIFAVALLSIVVLSTIAYSAGRYALGSSARWPDALGVAAVSAVPYTAGVACLYLFSHVDLILGAALYLLWCFVSLFCAYLGFRKALGVSDDKTVYAASFAYLITLVVAIAFLKSVLF